LRGRVCEVKQIRHNPLQEKLLETLRQGGSVGNLNVDIDGDLPDGDVKRFLKASRRLDNFSVAVAGSSIRDLIMGINVPAGDIDLAVGSSTGSKRISMHVDSFHREVNNSRGLFEREEGRDFADKLHLSSPRYLRKKEDGTWIFNKTTMASQYSFDYVGLMNTGQMIDPYGGVRDMFKRSFRLDYLIDDYRRDKPTFDNVSKDRRLSYGTVARALFPKYKWGGTPDEETEKELVNHEPRFSCSDEELGLLEHLAMWTPDSVTFIGDLKRYNLFQPLAEAAHSSEKTQTFTERGRMVSRLNRAGAETQEKKNEDRELIPKSVRMKRFLGNLEDKVRKPMAHELNVST